MASSKKQPARRLTALVILSLAGGVASRASEVFLSISQPATDSSQMTVEASYPSSLIQSPWDVYSRTEMGSAGTDGWTRIGPTVVLTGGVFTSWAESAGTNRFYALGRQTLDSDGDGLSDAYEQLTSHTNPQKADTDGDGVSDGDEALNDFTDPLSAASHSTQTILRVAGARIVDGNGKPVLLRGVNIGGWLAYEQWMVKLRASGTNAQDDYYVRRTLDGRFGTTGTTYLLNIFRDKYFTTNDMDTLKGPATTACACRFKPTSWRTKPTRTITRPPGGPGWTGSSRTAPRGACSACSTCTARRDAKIHGIIPAEKIITNFGTIRTI